MRILLVGEYSRLHNSLKEGLTALGHEVTLVGDGDGFKNYPADYRYDASWCNTKLANIARQGIVRLFNFDIARIERGFRFYFLLKKLKGYDVVQLINETPIKTTVGFEKFLLKKLFKHNQNIFLLCCGTDYLTVQYMLVQKARYSVMTPYFENPSLIKQYSYMLAYTTPAHKKLHDLVQQNINGIIASDIDYLLPMQGQLKFLGMVPNPVNTEKLSGVPVAITDKIVIFLGINRWNQNQKGIRFFEEALAIIRRKYPDSTEVIITENIPYAEYIKIYDRAHILLDQVYGYDQGYNALEAMAKGKVVFTGAETEFMEYYKLHERVAVNALPDTNAIVSELSWLIENPAEITAIGNRAKDFIEREHNYIISAQMYLDLWGK